MQAHNSQNFFRATFIIQLCFNFEMLSYISMPITFNSINAKQQLRKNLCFKRLFILHIFYTQTSAPNPRLLNLISRLSLWCLELYELLYL